MINFGIKLLSANGLWTFLIILGVAAVIALISFILHRLLHPKLKQEKKDDKKIAQEELDRILVPIEDEKTAKEVEDYKDKEDEKTN